MTQEVDAGCIVEQTMIEFDGTELFQEIRTLQAEATFALIKNFSLPIPYFRDECREECLLIILKELYRIQR